MDIDKSVLRKWKALKERKDVGELIELIHEKTGRLITKQAVGKVFISGKGAPDVVLIITGFYAKKKGGTTQAGKINKLLREVIL